MGLLDTLEGVAGSALGGGSDEDHVEDGLDGPEGLLDDVGGVLDAIGGANPVSKALAGVAGVVDKVENVVSGLLSEQDRPDVLPVVQYTFAQYASGKAFQDQDVMSSLGGVKGLGHIADNAIGMLGGPSGLVKSAEALVGDFGAPSAAAVPDWWVHEFHCTEALNDLFEMTVLLVRRESHDASTTPADPTSTIDGLLHNPGNVGQAVAAATTLAGDFAKALKPGSGNDQDLLDDLTRHTDPATAFFDKAVPPGPLDPDSYLGTTCSVHLKRTMVDDSVLTERWFTGVCCEFEDLGYIAGGTDGNIRMIRLVLRPSLWMLSLRKNCRIFQGQNAVWIVKKVFEFAGIYQGSNLLTLPPSIVPGIPIAVSEDAWLPKREYCVQYNETDLEFVQRLLAEEGVSFHFDHQDGAERVVLLDNAKASSRKCKTIDGKPASITDNLFVGSDGLEHVWDYGARNRLMPPRVTLRDFNPSIPDTPTEALFGVSPTSALSNPSLGSITDALGGLASKALGGAAKDYGLDAEHYEYPARFTLEADTSDAQHVAYKRYGGANVAKFYNKMYRGLTETCEGSSNLVNLIAGGALRLFTTLPVAAPGPGGTGYGPDRATREAKRGQKLIMTRVVHTGTIGTAAGAGNDAQSSPGYFNTFQGVVSKTTPLKPLPRPVKPVIAGVQTATVVDPHLTGDPVAGDVSSTRGAVCDDLGRVCVRFHWDRRDGNANDVVTAPAASAFLRVSQALAGAQWGAQFVPRIGMEVAVGFLEGDPDRPVILGALYGRRPDQNPAFPPRRSPEDYTYSGIVTQSYPADPGEHRHNQLVFKDVGGNEEIHLRAQRIFREQVHGDYTTVVGHDVKNTVDGDQTEDILRNQTLVVHGKRTKEVGGREVNDIGSAIPPNADDTAMPVPARTTAIHGNQRIRVERGNRQETVKEWDSLAVDGLGARPAPDESRTEAIVLQVQGHNRTEVLRDDRMVVANDRTVTVDGAYSVKAGALVLGSEDTTGGTGVHSTPQGTRLDAQSRIVVQAKGNIDIVAETQDATKGVEVIGPSHVALMAGADDHISVTFDEAEKRVMLRGREHGVRLQWNKDIYLEVTPTTFTLAAGTAMFTVKQGAAGFAADFTTPGTLDFAFHDQMAVVGQSVKMADGPAIDPSAPPDPTNHAQLLVEKRDKDEKGDKSSEDEWNRKFLAQKSTSHDAVQTDANYDDDGSTKKYAPPGRTSP